LSDSEITQLDAVAGELYRTFTAKVADARKLSPDAAEALARGRVWSGRAAQANGLIDELVGLAAAVRIAREKSGIPPAEAHQLFTVRTAKTLAGFGPVFGAPSPSWETGFMAETLGIPAAWAPAFLGLIRRGGALLIGSLIDP
jgi:protease-4